MTLARNILDILFPPRHSELLVRKLSSEELLAYMEPRALASGAVALLPYRAEPVRALILEAKFWNNARAKELLGHVLLTHLRSINLGSATLIPVPLSKKRLRERGYNQVQVVAEYACASLPNLVLAPELLSRTRHTLPQSTLGGMERRENIAGAFASTGSVDPGHTYIVLDDVITTGATLDAAVSALREAGAQQIIQIGLAH